METIELVKEFHEVFDHPIAEEPIIISHERMNFRYNFLKEELHELIEAWEDRDIMVKL